MGEANPLAILLNYGVLGIVVVLLVSGWVRTKPEVDNLKEQIASLRDEIREYKRQVSERDRVAEAMRVQLTQQTLPALNHSAQVLENIPQASMTEKVLVQELQNLVAQMKELADDGT